MRVAWAPSAERDRADIFDHVCADNPSAAVRLDERIADAANRLANHPKLGRA